jgi:hypothetical protein
MTAGLDTVQLRVRHSPNVAVEAGGGAVLRLMMLASDLGVHCIRRQIAAHASGSIFAGGVFSRQSRQSTNSPSLWIVARS